MTPSSPAPTRLAALCALALLALSRAAAAPVINEIMYRPGTAYPENTALEFIELHNPDSTAVDLSGWAITTGADYTFASGTTIAAGGYLVVAANPTSLKAASASAAAATVAGPWKTGASLANRGETITLAKPGSTSGTWTTVDEVSYAHEGDWATRTRDSLGGWSWTTGANSSGASLERRNPKLASTNGQNWGASSAVGGTPGAANSLFSSNIAPVITAVKHTPAVPTSSDAVTLSCKLADEAAYSSLTATLFWRVATSASPGAFQTLTMEGDETGTFSAALPAMADKTIVEFYVSASDGSNTRTWPAPTSEGQNANCAYQVDNEVATSAAPVYRLVLTAAENAAFATYTAGTTGGGGGMGGGGGGIGDRQFNFTLVVSRGSDTTIRYRTSMRVRGNSSRNYTIKPLRISLPRDDRWDGISDFMINPRGAPVALLAHRIQRAAGLVAADASPIEVRRNGTEYTVTTGATADHGQLVRVEQLDGDYLDNHFPLAVSSQLYRKVSISGWSYAATTAPSNPDTTWSGWSKESNSDANDWSDVMNFSKVWQETAAPYFTGASTGNVAAGTWNGTAFSDADYARLSEVADLDYLARWLAVMTIMPNAEENLSTGEDDDYAGAFVNDGTRTRFIAVPHDMDTTFGLGEVATTATNKGLYDVTEIGNRTGNFADVQMKPLLPLLGDSTRAGHATFRQKYLTALRELYGSLFDADTSSNANPPFYQFVDNHLGWTPASYRSQIKTFATQRQTYLLGLIGSAKIAPTAGTSTATLAATSTPTLRINEVLATNTKIANGSTFPDIIELHNAGSSAVDLAGKSLSDDAAEPRKYVFPSGTTIAAGGYLVIYADTETAASGLHAGFSLDAEGDTVRLYDTTAAGGTLLDSVTFGFQVADYSISRTGSGGTWALTSPTPGGANGGATALGSIASVKINEWAGRIKFRVDHDFIELHNAAAQPVALGGARLTDDVGNYPKRFEFPALSFIATGGFLPLYGADIPFALDADADVLTLLGENGAAIDQVDFTAQPADQSTARATDGGTTWTTLSVPTPGISNATALPANHTALLNNLRITEVMFDPAASSNASDYEFIELQNIGTATLDLGGVRFTNGIDYTFPAGTTLAGGAFIVVAKARTTFLTRYPSAASVLAPGSFSGALDNNGENIALTLPAPWYVHILKFRYETDWYPAAAGRGCSIVTRAAASTLPENWDQRLTWRASSATNGNPGAADTGGLSVVAGQSGTVNVTAGNSTTLSVTVNSSGSATYQWQQLVNGTWVNLAGATSRTLSLLSAQSYDSSTYRAVVTASGLVVTSDPVVIAVSIPGASTARLLNLSTRGVAGTGSSQLIPGFVISGTGTKRLLVRAVGPTLGSFGVSGTLADPQLALKRYDSATGAYVDVAANDNWGTAGNVSTIISTTASVGGFALASGSADAALLVDLPAGQYSALTSGANNGTGLALVELYDGGSGSDTTRLANIATRGFVSTGGEILISGFVVSSEGAKTLLIRAVGPTLGSFGVTGTLADPQLTIYGRPSGATSDQAILSNDNWSSATNATEIATVAAQVGAFALTSGSKDAAMLVTLQPGSYTVQASGIGGTTGVALIEVYVVQ